MPDLSTSMGDATKEYNINVTEGIVLYEKVMKSKSYKNVVNFGKRALTHFDTALKLAKPAGMKDKVDYIYEYRCVINSSLGDAEKNEKNILQAIQCYSEALKDNENTKKNTHYHKRKVLLNFPLMQLSVITQKYTYAVSFANQVIDAASNVLENPVFALDAMKKTEETIAKYGTELDVQFLFESILNLAKNKKVNEFVKSEGYWIYGKYLLKIKLNKSKALKYMQKARELYSQLKNDVMVQVIDTVIKEMDQPQTEISGEKNESKSNE
jgi:tetratricopeptide (TPR) repeat protein